MYGSDTSGKKLTETKSGLRFETVNK